MVGFFIIISGFAYIAVIMKSDAIRNPGFEPVDQNGNKKRRPYSLARTQMALWTFLVVAGFVWIWVNTGKYEGVIPSSIFALMGISATSTVLAAALDDSKLNDEESNRLGPIKAKIEGTEKSIVALTIELATLNSLGASQQSMAIQKNGELQNARQLREQLTAAVEEEKRKMTLASENFFRDIFTDAYGFTLHRLQMAIWTVVMAIIFVKSVVGGYVMPIFDDKLLGLMGISSGTYLGFKFPETHLDKK